MALATLPENNSHFDKNGVNVRVWGVLKELQHRQQILLEIKSIELKWKFCLLVGGITSIFALMARSYAVEWGIFLPAWLILLFLLVDCLIFFRLRRLQVRLQKAQVNFGVLRHHLIGMVEVGLCRCSGECDCKDIFRRQALREFRINLY
ncbi:MAG TPA: hypothetical protein VFF14_03850 [Candidatus Deferrimicrobium sp.]|nr:hypothetical protein [Candidatus Deferrimicrobium sp.]